MAKILLGTLHASIKCSSGYWDDLIVDYDTETRLITCKVMNCTPFSDQYDSDKTTPPTLAFSETCSPSTIHLHSLIKRIVQDPKHLFKQYGKPSKNFIWRDPQSGAYFKGISLETIKSIIRGISMLEVRVQGVTDTW